MFYVRSDLFGEIIVKKRKAAIHFVIFFAVPPIATSEIMYVAFYFPFFIQLVWIHLNPSTRLKR